MSAPMHSFDLLDLAGQTFESRVGLIAENEWSGFATRCWPECFTDFGGAACAPQAMLTNAGIPGGCEADVYGTLTSLASIRNSVPDRLMG